MAESKSSPIVTRVVAGVLTAAAIGAASFVPGIFRWLSEIVALAWSHFLGTSRLPNWSVYMLVAISIPTITRWVAALKKPSGPRVTSYNQDKFFGLVWRWSYISGHPANAWAYCPHDDTMLVYSNIPRHFNEHPKVILTCETCNRDVLKHEGDKNYLVEKIHRQIDRKIRTGEWEKHVVDPRP